MFYKRLFALIAAFLLLACTAAAEGSYVLNRTDNLTEEYRFAEDAPLLEVVFPRVYSSDCAIVRFGDEVMMIDASTKNVVMRRRIESAVKSMGIDTIDIAYNSHPHDDHIDGFQFVDAYAPIGKLLIAFPEDYDGRMKETVQYMNDHNIPIEHVQDGDVLTMGPHDEVTMTVIQRWGTKRWDTNDQSAMLLIRYGDRTILFCGDVENRAQQSYADDPPACGLDADIIKYPHHGQVKLLDPFLEVISPELALMNGGTANMKDGMAYMEKKQIPYLIGHHGLTRMRTDGQIWVVDYLYEVDADRTTIQPDYQ